MYFRLMVDIFDSLSTLDSKIIHVSPIVLLGSENVGVAVRIVLLSCIQDDKLVIAYVLPVNGDHLCFF